MDVWKVENCRACQGETINVFSLGNQFVSNFPADKGLLPQVKYPLDLMRCHRCGLVQLTHTVNPDRLYKGHYWYRSGINESMRSALKDVVLRAIEMTGLGMYDVETVVDIGANDGTLLSFYPDRVYRVGVEPATSLHGYLEEHCSLMIPDYFPPKNITIGDGEARIVTSIAMFYDLDRPNQFVAEVKRILHEHGLWIIQMADLGLMLSTGGYDNICHEHLEYYSVSALQSLLARHELKILKVEFNKVNGGSMRVYVSHKNSTIPVLADDVTFLHHVIKTEEEYVRTNEPWIAFREQSRVQRIELGMKLRNAFNSGLKVDLLGASTKANTMLQFCGVGTNFIRRAIERDTRKIGRYTVTGIPIVGEEEGRQDPADILLVGPWHFRDSFIFRERGKWPVGTKLLFPLPVVEEVSL